MVDHANAPGLDDLASLSRGEIAALPAAMLADLQSELAAASARLKTLSSRLTGALEMRYGARVLEALRADDRDTGTVRFDDEGLTVIADLPKRVEWDQAKLARIAANIAASGEDPGEFIDTKLSVSERRYAALPEAWRKGFEPARTVKTGALKVVLAARGERS
ncbi:hypothetical protein L2D00_14580 [Hyphomonadaceae bacterium BL14]|nr:hypothetical protein L2D00_14580 [Hyphomonadaceae bacterium BL14]